MIILACTHLHITIPLLVHIICGVRAEIITSTSVRRREMDNRNTSLRMLWRVNLRGSPLCVAACKRDVKCATAFFNSNTRMCQGHSITFGHSNLTQLEQNTGYFVQPQGEHYIGDACMAAAECVTVRTECRQGQCMCIPGYSFSPRTHECLPACSKYGTEFLEIKDHYISKYNLETFQPSTLEECFDLCYNRTAYLCLSVEFEWTAQKCNLANVTVLDVPTRWYEDTTMQFNVSYYQRDCD